MERVDMLHAVRLSVRSAVTRDPHKNNPQDESQPFVLRSTHESSDH